MRRKERGEKRDREREGDEMQWGEGRGVEIKGGQGGMSGLKKE